MDTKFLIFFLTIIHCHSPVVESANILVVMPLSAPSHFKSFQPLFEELVERGHKLTLISGFRLSETYQSNYTLVNVKAHFNKLKIVFAELRKQSRIYNFIFTSNSVQNYAEEILNLSEVQSIIDSNDKYDLVIAELFFMDSIFAFGYKFNAPIIAVSPLPLTAVYNWIFGNTFPASYCPNSFLPYSEKMSLGSRIVNMAFNFVSVLFYEFVSLSNSQTQIEKYFHFDHENVPHIKNIMKNISITLVNTHYSFGYLKPELPNVINVAGLHFSRQKPMPKNIQKFMDEGVNGVIYLSLGSLIEPQFIASFGKLFIDVFKDVSQRVVMKWDPKLLTDVPSNVLVQEWIPQIDVLNHPNCRLFVTHGGLHSLLESLNASVPLVGIPFFSDQQYNMALVEHYEMGNTLAAEKLSTELLPKVNEVLNNPKYKQNVEKRSSLFRERLTSPMDTATYWIDHVLKHKNATHLKSASLQLTWYELYSLDVLTILAAAIMLAGYIIKVFIKKIKQKMVPCVKTKINVVIKSLRKEKLMVKYD